MSRDDARPGLTRAAYERLRRAAPTTRTDLVLRLAGEVGLRPAEMAELRLADVRTVAAEGRDHYLLDLDGREAYLPRSVERDLRQYANAAGRDPDEAVFDVSARRLQMLVGEAGAAAADAGHDDLADVSSADLRDTFARRWLDDGTDPAAVLSAAAWSRLERLSPFLPSPDGAALVSAFAATERGEGVPPAALSGARAVAGSVADAADDADVRERVAAALSAADRYRRGWVEPPGTEATAAVEGAADLRERLLDAAPSLLTSARETGAVQTSVDVGPGVVAVAPVPRRDGPDEALVVAADALAAGERDLLALLGRLVGLALTATRQRRRLLSETTTRAVFGYRGGPLPALSAALSCPLSLAGVVPHGEGSLLLFVDVEDARPDAVLAAAGEVPGLADVRLVADYGDSTRFEAVVGEDTALAALVASGATPVALSVAGGSAEVTVDLPADADVRAAVSAVEAAGSSVELRSKRQVDRPADPAARFGGLPEGLTDRQASTLRAAYLAGYFEWPRESTAESLAASLDVSAPTFHQHLRKAQGKLLDAYFDSSGT